MFTVFNTALSGLSANSTAIDIVGNNLANLNTAGFKGSSAQFQDLFNAAIALGVDRVEFLGYRDSGMDGLGHTDHGGVRRCHSRQRFLRG